MCNCNCNENIIIPIEICRKDVTLPQYARQGDAGMDVCSAVDFVLKPNETVVIPTGLKMAIPEGYEIQVRPRSGLSLKTPLRIANSPGTIDSGYRNEIGIIVTNTSNNSDYTINAGDRIAQFVLQKVPTILYLQVDSVADIGYNRGGGFGSTGV